MRDYSNQIIEVLDSCHFQFSTIKPSQWAEQKRVMDSSVSPFPGPFSFNVNPYTREILDTLSPDHPAHTIAVMKGAQIGFSAAVIENAVGWIIDQSPGNILFLTGHSDLSEEAVTKIDQMIDSCGLRSLIRPSVMRAKAMKTGDTNTKKEFPGGSLVSGSAGNHKLLRQRSVRYGFIDDFEAAKHTSKESGSTRKMIEQRFAAYADKRKVYYISTPEIKLTSNIEPVYLLGDQRKYHIPCPCCGDYIFLAWSIPIDGTDGKEVGGITWKVDSIGKLIPDSVGYICQKCGGFFTDHNKYELNLAGEWRPTAEPSEIGFYSYHISSLYAPPGMYDWKHYANDWITAHPSGQNRNESLYKAFVNLVLGETYVEEGEAPKANELQKNIRKYEVGSIPEKISEKDGNGKIILLTCACDLNGKEDDARLDYEIVGWSESNSSYSIKHGSIGTFVYREGEKKFKDDRQKWTYQHNQPNSVWPELDKVLDSIFETDTGRKMKILITGIDCGHFTNHVYAYLDRKNNPLICGIRGDKENKFRLLGIDTAKFKQSRERQNMYMTDVNLVKDELASNIRLRWEDGFYEMQPPGFMNYPTPSGGLYLYSNFFSHYEAEHKVPDYKDGEPVAFRWQKKNSNVQNHMWDVRVYNMVLKDILIFLLGKDFKEKTFTWADYVGMVSGVR